MRSHIVACMLCLVGQVARLCAAEPTVSSKPNIVIVVADDMGWRDTSYQGNPVIKTPQLDSLASHGIQFDYFYAGQQMCSPGRFAILTGRNPCRTGLYHLGAMRPQEITVARALKTAGYNTGMFGKWHLDGHLPTTTPAKMGFDRALWAHHTFDLGASLRVGDTSEKVPLSGDTSVAVMDLALQWIGEQVNTKAPFLAYICFGSPHEPNIATEEFKAPYKGEAEDMQNYWGEVAGIDAAVGNLRSGLRKMGIADDTIIWFTSDNGGITQQSLEPNRLKKGDIGVRTPTLLEWPARVKRPFRTDVVCNHVDIYPTILEITGVTMSGQPPVDGVSLLPLLDDQMSARPKPVGFMLWGNAHSTDAEFYKIDFVTDTQGVWIDGNYKLVVEGRKDLKDQKDLRKPPIRLFDIYADPAEKNNLAGQHPEIVQRMRSDLNDWRRSVRSSYEGHDW